MLVEASEVVEEEARVASEADPALEVVAHCKFYLTAAASGSIGDGSDCSIGDGSDCKFSDVIIGCLPGRRNPIAFQKTRCR